MKLEKSNFFLLTLERLRDRLKPSVKRKMEKYRYITLLCIRLCEPHLFPIALQKRVQVALLMHKYGDYVKEMYNPREKQMISLNINRTINSPIEKLKMHKYVFFIYKFCFF